ncbi:MAG: hypothetical protein HY240_08370, partial [Actinobacteria bacterium]|nr:hypothetical protein [Actinomycetota bacterium]
AWLAIAVILALWLAAPSRLSWARRAVVVLGAVMILPNVTAMEHGSLQLPAFFAADTYRNYLSPNEIVLPIPFGQRPGGAQEMIWLAETDMYFRVAGGHVGWVPRVDQVPVTRSLISNQPGSIDPGDLQVFLVTHHVGAIVVGGAYASQWAGLLETTLRTQPVEVGGVQLYLVRDGVGVPVPGPGPSSGIP